MLSFSVCVLQLGTQWLIWKFESDSTLADACQGNLGKFPEDLDGIVLGGRA